MFEIKPIDAPRCAVAVVLFLAVTLIASAIPADRLTLVDSITTLRQE